MFPPGCAGVESVGATISSDLERGADRGSRDQQRRVKRHAHEDKAPHEGYSHLSVAAL